MAAFYRNTLREFLDDEESHVLGHLLAKYQHQELQKRQTKAWLKEIQLLKLFAAEGISKNPHAANWWLLLEYPIPRRQKRLDAVVLAEDVIVCLEYKTEDKAHSLQADRQVEEYGLDLRDFHAASNGRKIIPIVVVPNAQRVENEVLLPATDPVQPVLHANGKDLWEVAEKAFVATHCQDGIAIDGVDWDSSAYLPVPTIIEAAEALYAGHNVAEIARSHSGAANLTLTSKRLLEVVSLAQQNKFKAICFVTGVPGAGKTLAGLNVVHNQKLRSGDRPAGVFLSGNGPLVKIVSAAIARDYKKRKKQDGDRTVDTFIQNVHVFVRESLEKSDKPPVEKVVVFDEAQRAWDAVQNAKKNENAPEGSEPETMLSIMDRHPDWTVLIALVGGGQEIHDGEAGLAEWGKALQAKFQHWRVFVSPHALSGGSSLAGHRLFNNDVANSIIVQKEPALHLDVSLRSFRAQRVTEWVEAVLELNPEKAQRILSELRTFPIIATRSLEIARNWLRTKTRGQRRCGLVASSGAVRLRADGIELSSGFRQGNRDMFVHWFLAKGQDVRSSNQLEIAASEFECQGLELDWVGICWGGNFCFDDATQSWQPKVFRGTNWQAMTNESDRRFLLNTYRVLLTRARQGLVIWIPEGSDEDNTRRRENFNATAAYFGRCGVSFI